LVALASEGPLGTLLAQDLIGSPGWTGSSLRAGAEALPEQYRLLLGGALVLYLVFGMFTDMDDRPVDPRPWSAPWLG
jgi:hypothetical protein